jgi:hypothetical protein
VNQPEKPETATERRRRAREEQAGGAVKADPEVDPFAEFHDGWEPVRKRQSEIPRE